jgi:hypothetical protein
MIVFCNDTVIANMFCMRMEEARGFVFQVLRQGGANQFGQLLSNVGINIARKRDPSFDVSRLGYEGGNKLLTDQERTLILEVVWSLIIQGILIPGLSDSNQGWPFLRLTEYGQRCVQEDRILPHDPEGFLREFNREVPTADPTLVEYLTEALQCYIRGLHRSAAVMLGGASEKAVLLLIESYARSIADSGSKQSFQSKLEKAQSIFRKYELFDQRFAGLKQRMPGDLTDNVDSQLRGVFDLIRGSRNDAGHPAIGSSVNRDAVYSHLRLFTPYCKRIEGLIAWFTANQT